MCRQRRKPNEYRSPMGGCVTYVAIALGTWLLTSPAFAQGTGMPSTSPMPVNSAPFLQNDPSTRTATPLTTLDPIVSNPPPNNPPSISLGTPTFDPYSTGSNQGYFQPAIPSQQANGIPPSSTINFPATGSFPANGSQGPPASGGWTGSVTGYPTTPPPVPYGAQPSQPYAGQPFPGQTYSVQPPSYPASIYPQSAPPVLFPGASTGMYGANVYGDAPGNYYNPFSQMAMPSALKFFQGPRVQYGWLGGGDDSRDLGIQELETSLAFAFPNFLWSGQPIFVLPSFSLDLWDGPKNQAADLPGQAYEAFVDAGWQTDPNNIWGLETGLRIGVFTDFDTMNSDSVRYMGQVLGKLRISPQATLKAGVMYIDRNEIKVLPAGGILWQPTPYSRWDIYFPEPKISNYFRTVGTQDVWGYIAGEFGGGSWTIQRANGSEDSVDINDIRVMFGLEWGRSDLIRIGRRTAFAEAGWVFNRQVRYARNPADDFDADSTFLFRVGIGY